MARHGATPGGRVLSIDWTRPDREDIRHHAADSIAARQAILVRAINAEVARRMRCGRSAEADSVSTAGREAGRPLEARVEELLSALFEKDRTRLALLVEALREQRPRLVHLYRALLVPVAARLGNMWRDDSASFVDVTVASARLQFVVNELTAHVDLDPPRAALDRRVLLARPRGEAHTIGLAIVEACFRSAGWEACGGAVLEADSALFSELQSRSYSVLGLSVGSIAAAEGLAETIKAARKVSRNRAIKVCLGGAAVAGEPRLFAAMGADFLADDAMDAVVRAGQAVA